MLIPVLWLAAGTTAMSVTGDVRFQSTKLAFANGASIRIRYVHDVPSRVSFWGDSLHTYASGSLYRVEPPADPTLLHGKPFCGAPATYLTVLPIRHGARTDVFLSVYTGTAQPTGAPSDRLCAAYSYLRARS